MSKENDFLNQLYQNVEMGRESLNEVLSNLEEGSAIVSIIRNQLADYEHQLIAVKEQLLKRNAEIEDSSAVGKFMTQMSISLKTMMDATDSKIAEMVIQGANMGILDLNKLLNKETVLDSAIKELAQDILTMEQKHIDELKPYL